jgi:dTDP-L-rhamnose 4-epimerase
MKTLITGGLGFIGQALARRLVGEGHEVVLLDTLSPQIHGELPCIEAPAGTTVVRADVVELASRSDLLEGCDVVFHLAAETGTAQSMYRIGHYVKVNELGTAALLEAIAGCSRRPRRLVLASSRSVYGEGAYRTKDGRLVQPDPRTSSRLQACLWEHADADGAELQAIPTPESLPFAPGSVYAATKASQELLVRSASQALGLKCVILRFQNVYGEGQSLLNPYTGIISIFFNRARQGLRIPIYEDGRESRDFVHVSDVVAALSVAKEAGVRDGLVVNVGAGQPTSVAELARVLLEVSGFDVPVEVTSQYRLGDIRHCFADLTQLREEFGLVPQVSLAQGLARFCEWAHGQPVHVDRLETATDELRRKGLTGR